MNRGQKTVQVATRLIPPFVFEEKGKLTGFSVELWEAIAANLEWKSTFDTESGVQELLQSVKSGKAELGIAAISITSERGKTFDFSQPIYDGGLQILIRTQGDSNDSSLWNYVQNFFKPNVLRLLGTLLLMALVGAHLVWLLERGAGGDGLIETKKYFPGIFKALWWSAATIGAQADEMPKTYAARIVAVLWMFTSIFFVAYFTAQLTSDLTIQRLSGTIHGPDDLPGHRTATTAGSTAEAYLKENRINVKTFPTIDEAYAALDKGDVDAVVFDSPVLLYYAAHDGKDKADIVGPVFKKEAYGIVFPPSSPYRRQVNESLLRLKENGDYDALYNKWFAPPGGG